MRSTDSSQHTRWRFRILGALGVALALLAAEIPNRAEEASGGEAGLKFTLERLGQFTYAGDPVMVRVAVFNTGEKAFENASGLDLLGNLGIINLDEGRRLAARQDRAPDRRLEPAVIPPGGFFGRILDLRDAVVGMDAPGRYTARLSLEGSEVQEIPLVVIPRFEPQKPYRAVVETDYGTLVFDLLGKEAPKHVQNFYDLANQGYYDGTLVHAVVKGIEIHAGDRAGDGTSTPGYSLGPEVSSGLKHQRGTLSMLRMGPNDHGSLFVISLGETRERDGVFTIFGALASGEEALAAIENLPTAGTRDAVPYRPLAQVRIQSVRVAPAPDGSRATATSG